MKQILKCPKCKSQNINQYRNPAGKIWCEDCKFTVPQKEICNPFIFPRVKDPTYANFKIKPLEENKEEVVEYTCSGTTALSQCQYAILCGSFFGCKFKGNCKHKKPEMSALTFNDNEKVLDLLSELADIVDGHVNDGDKLDSLTTQPAKTLLRLRGK